MLCKLWGEIAYPVPNFNGSTIEVWAKISYFIRTLLWMQLLSLPRDGRVTWWRHQLETFSTLLAICAENSPVSGEFSAQRPVTRSFDVLFDMRLNKRLSKQSWGWWFETLSRPLWRHRNGLHMHQTVSLWYHDMETLSASRAFCEANLRWAPMCTTCGQIVSYIIEL